MGAACEESCGVAWSELFPESLFSPPRLRQAPLLAPPALVPADSFRCESNQVRDDASSESPAALSDG
jgi:hypothetical protein